MNQAAIRERGAPKTACGRDARSIPAARVSCTRRQFQVLVLVFSLQSNIFRAELSRAISKAETCRAKHTEHFPIFRQLHATWRREGRPVMGRLSRMRPCIPRTTNAARASLTPGEVKNRSTFRESLTLGVNRFQDENPETEM